LSAVRPPVDFEQCHQEIALIKLELGQVLLARICVKYCLLFFQNDASTQDQHVDVGRLKAAVGVNAATTGGPFADSLERENGRFVKRRREKSAGRVRLVMIERDIGMAVVVGQLPVQFPWKVELLSKPE
jgi:hypothetical protein